MSSAGQANEAGSVFRRDAAVYFAVHALAGNQVGSLLATSPVTRIDFETADPTDDFRVCHQDGIRFYVSAKRAAGLDDHTRDTVAAWVRQVPTLRDDDLLVLAVSEASGTLRKLQQALDRARAGAPRPVDADALKWLDDLVPAKCRSIVRERAYVIEFVRTPVSNDDHNLLVTMMNNLVEDHRGAAALDCLAAHLHTTAGLGSGSGVEEWVALLEAGGFRLRPAAAGSGAVRCAMAVKAYHRALTKEQGVIDLSLLADDLGPLPPRDILGGVQVAEVGRERSANQDLCPIVRRKRRLLLIGQPGTGKTKTLWELAAWCVQDENAPEPIRVKLSRLVTPQRPDSLELADLVADAAALVPVDDQAHVRAHLRRAASTGDAILVLDGLDECGDQVGWVAQQLAALVAGLHPDTGVVLATRPSAEMPARRLKFGEVVLQTPQNLRETMDAVLDHCASARIPEPAREAWLDGRRAWLDEALKEHEAMLGVPQLALLVMLLAAESLSAEVPHSRAEVLGRAVRQAVERWELNRFAAGISARWSPSLSPGMLLDGFVTLGRLLDGQPEQPKAAALNALTETLRNPDLWDEAPAKARELAPEILRFWDEHVGVFTVDDSDQLSARSKVFCEVATAMWVSRCTDAVMRTWVEDSIPFYDAQGAISLAQGLDARVSDALLDIGESSPMATLAVGNAVLSNVHQPGPQDMERLFGQLVRHALDIERGCIELPERMNRPGAGALEPWKKRRDKGPRSWVLVKVLCTIKLPENLREEREQAISDLQLAPPYPDITRAIAALVNAHSDGRALTEEELRDVQTAVDIDIPERPKPVRQRRTIVIGESTTPLGLGMIADLAIDHLRELAPGSGRKLAQMSRRIGFRDSFKVARRLHESGIETKPWGDALQSLVGLVAMFSDHVEHEQTLLKDIASLGDKDIRLTKADRWSLTELADLLYATGYAEVGFAEFRSAFSDDTAELRRPWLRAMAVVHGLDLDKLAAEAQHVLNIGAANDSVLRLDEWSVLVEEPAPSARSADLPLMGDDEQRVAVACLFAHSTWLVDTSMWLLVQTTATWDREQLFNAPLDGWAPTRSSTFRQVAIVADPASREMLERAAASEYSAYRHAARRAIELCSSLDPEGTVRAKMAADPDQWVRGPLHLDPPAPPAEYWSCPWCPTRNPINADDCSGCTSGTRPNLDK